MFTSKLTISAALLALEFLSPVLVHNNINNKTLFVVATKHWDVVKVGFSKPQQKVRFQLFRLPFPVTTDTIEAKNVLTLLLPVPEGYVIIGPCNDGDWKGVELQLEELEKTGPVDEFEEF